VKCAAHLRDIGNAIQMYANENQYHIPTVQTTYSNQLRPMWYDQLAKYAFKSGVASETPGVPGSPISVVNDANFGRTAFVGCPAFDYSYYKNKPTGTATGYGLNLIPVPVQPPATQWVNQYPRSGSVSGRYFKIHELKNPANHALMADANGYGGIRAQDPDPTYYTKPNGNNVLGDIDYYRHGRQQDLSRPGCNVLFADLHVSLCTPWAAFWAVRDPSRHANGSN